MAVGRERRPGSKRIRLTAQAESLRLPPKLKRDRRHRSRSRRRDGTAATVTAVSRTHIFELRNRADRAVPRQSHVCNRDVRSTHDGAVVAKHANPSELIDSVTKMRTRDHMAKHRMQRLGCVHTRIRSEPR